MGPFPHDAPKSVISAENPAGTDGFEFVEFASPEPEELRVLFTKMGYELVARHKTKPGIELWQQGDITYILNAEAGSFAEKFVELHGPCAPSMGWRVVDAQKAFDHAVARGAEPYEGDDKTMDVPAIMPTSMPSSSSARKTPICAHPRAASPPRASAALALGFFSGTRGPPEGAPPSLTG